MLKTKNGIPIDVEELTWLDIITQIKPINSNLATKLRNVSAILPNCTFYKASYTFGSKIISKNNCYLPLSNGESLAFDDEQLPDSLREDLAFNPTTEDPLGMILNKTSEFYLSPQDRLQPCSLIHKGQLFGTPRATNQEVDLIPMSALNSNLNAGARSLFMLSSICNNYCHLRLKQHYKTKLDAPNSSEDHYEFFVELAKKAESTWRSEILYFPRKFINKLKTDEWELLAYCLLRLHRTSYSSLHSASEIWNAVFRDVEHQQGLTNYNLDSLLISKQMFIIAGNSTPGYRPALNDDCAPISLFIDAYTNIYKIPHYTPIIMEPAKFDIHTGDPVYYSINYLKNMQDNSKISNKKTNLGALHEILWVNSRHVKGILSGAYNTEPLYSIAKKVDFSCYHTDSKDYREIYDAALIPQSDPRFLQGPPEKFPIHSQFFKGCIKISLKD